MAGGRADPRTLDPHRPLPSLQDIRQKLVPMLRQSGEAPAVDPASLLALFQKRLEGITTRLLDWSVAELEFLDRLHSKGELDASLLHPDPDLQQRILLQPMLLWKSQNVRQHLKGRG